MSCRKISVTVVVLIMMVSLTLSGCLPSLSDQAASNEKTTIAVSGAFALYPMMVRWAEEYQKVHPEITIDVSAGGAGKGMTDALSGMVDIGMVSRDVKEEEKAQGAFDVAVAKDAVFPTANVANPVLPDLLKKGISQETFIAIFIDGTNTSWGQVIGNEKIEDSIHVYTRSDACGAAEVWASFLGGKKQEDLIGIGIFGDPGILDAVVKDALGIGYNNLNYVYDASTGKPVQGVVVIPIDTNENGQADASELLDSKEKAVAAVANGDYPSPPARLLYLVTKGKPSGAVKDFLVWIMNDGQAYLEEVGYIPLTEAQMKMEQEKLQ